MKCLTQEHNVTLEPKPLGLQPSTVTFGSPLLAWTHLLSEQSNEIQSQPVPIKSNQKVVLQAACGTVSAVSDCLSLFALFRFGAGAATAGCLLVRFVYCMEIIHINNRTAAGMVNNIFVSIGFSTLSLLGYLIRDWRHLMLIVSLPAAPLLLCYW